MTVGSPVMFVILGGLWLASMMVAGNDVVLADAGTGSCGGRYAGVQASRDGFTPASLAKIRCGVALRQVSAARTWTNLNNTDEPVRNE